MLTKTRHILYPLIFFFVLFLSTGELAFISMTWVFQAPINSEIDHSKPEVIEPASLIELWYDPLEPANAMIIQDEGRKVLWEGISYSVVSITPAGEDILYLCMTENGETYIESGAVSVSRQHSSHPKDRLKGKVLIGQYIFQESLFSLHCPYFNELSPGTPLSISNYYPEISPPPPRQS
jgi:hypothetical protein